MDSTRGTNVTGDGPRPNRSDSQSSQGSASDEPFRRISRRLREKADRRTERIEAEAIEGAGSDQENATRAASRIPTAPMGMRATDRIDTRNTKLPLPTKLRGNKDEPEVVTLSDSEDEIIAGKEKMKEEVPSLRAIAEEEETAKEVEAIMAKDVDEDKKAEEKQEEQVGARRGSTEEEGAGRPRRASRARAAASPARSPGRISRATAAAVRNETKSPAVLEVEDAVEAPKTAPRTRSSSRGRAASQVPETPTRRATRAASVAPTKGKVATLEIPDDEPELPTTTTRRSTRTPSRARAAPIEEEKKETENVAKSETRTRSTRSTTPSRGVQATPTRLTRGMRKAGFTTPGEKEEEPAKFKPLPDDDVVDLTKKADTEGESEENASEAKETAEKVQEKEEKVQETENVVDEVFDPVAKDDDSVKDGEEATKADSGPTKTTPTEEAAKETDVAPLETADLTAVEEAEDEIIIEKYITPKKVDSVDLTGDDEKGKEEVVTEVTPTAKTETVLATPARQLNEAISDRLISCLYTPAVKKTPVSSRVSALSGVTAVSTPIPGQGNSSFMDWEETGTPKVITDTAIAHAEPVPTTDDFDDGIQISYQLPKEAKKDPKEGADEEEELPLDVTQHDDFEEFEDMFKKTDVEEPEPINEDSNNSDPFDDIEDIYDIANKKRTLIIGEEEAPTPAGEKPVKVTAVPKPYDSTDVVEESSKRRQSTLHLVEAKSTESVEAPEAAAIEASSQEEPAVTTVAESTAGAEPVSDESVKEKTRKKKGKKSIVPSEVSEELVEVADAPEFTITVSPATEEPVSIEAEHTESVVDEPLKKKKGKNAAETTESVEAPEVNIPVENVTEAPEAAAIEASPQKEEPAVTTEAESACAESVVEESAKEKTKKKKKGKKSIVPSEVFEEVVEVADVPESTITASPATEEPVPIDAEHTESVVDEPLKEKTPKKKGKKAAETTESVEAPEVTIPLENVTEAPEAAAVEASHDEEEPAVTTEAEYASAESVAEESVKEKTKKKKKGKKSIVPSEVSEEDVEVADAPESTVSPATEEPAVSIEAEYTESVVDEPLKEKTPKKKGKKAVKTTESFEAPEVVIPVENVIEASEAAAKPAVTTEAESTVSTDSVMEETVKEKTKKKKKGKKAGLQPVDTESIDTSEVIAEASANQEETAAATEEPSVPTQDKKKKKKRQAEAAVIEKTEEHVVKEKEEKKAHTPAEFDETLPDESLVDFDALPVAEKTKKTKKRKAVVEEEDARKKVKIDEEEEKENIQEDQDVAKEEQKKKAKGKKMVVAEEEDVEMEADAANGALKFPNITFKKMFHKPSTCCNEISSALASLYTWSCKQRRADDLPDVFLNDAEETVWQFVAHKGRQIAKDFRKYKDLLDEPIVLPGLEDDDEEEGLSDLEMDDEEQDGVQSGEEDEEMAMDEEDENIDLFNLRDEDLKDLERELHDMNDEDDEAGPSSKEPAEKPKKFKKSIVDDKFFSLAEMDAFCDEQENKNDDEGILATVDDSWGGPVDYRYEEFFGKLDDVVGGEAPQKKQKAKKRKGEEVEMKASKKKKSVRFAMDEEDEGEEIEEEEPEAEEKETPVLLGKKEEEEKQESKLKADIRKLKESIRQLEQENLEPRSWELSGEVSAQQRAENTLLDTHMQVDNAAKRAPEVTEDFTERLEALIKQRIKDQAFDDVVRIKKVDEKAETYRNEAIEEMESMKKSLSEVYEKEYQKAAGQIEAAPAENEQHKAIQARVDSLFQLIDAMSHYDYTPPQVRPEIKIVSNMAALRVEEVGMLASTDAQLLAPEEIKKRAKGDVKAGEERTSTDKLRQRRKKKIKQRAMVMTVGAEKALAGQLEKKIQKKAKKDGSGGKKKDESMKSSNFFSKLQDTVNKEKKEKTTKKKKMVKSEKVSNGGAKFKL